MNKSEQINELAAALSKAQGAIKGALKDSSNPFFKSKYADLSSVWEACREQLVANGLSVSQSPCKSEHGYVGVETILLHSSGQWISNEFAIPVTKVDAQGFGSAITYARRYALAAIVGVAPEDDDGNAATGKSEEVKQEKYPSEVMASTRFKFFSQKINSSETKEKAKEAWQEAVKECSAIGDLESANSLKDLMLKRAKALTEKVEA